MKDFFKLLGQGVLWTVLLPFVLAIFLLFGVYLVIVYIVIAIKTIVLFFSGRNLDDKLPEEIEAENILKNMVYNPQVGMYQNPNAQQTPTISQQVMYQNVNLSNPGQINQNMNPTPIIPTNNYPHQAQNTDPYIDAQPSGQIEINPEPLPMNNEVTTQEIPEQIENNDEDLD